MNNYVVGNLRIAKDRLYADPANGGLGLIDLDQFLVGLHVSWVKKAGLSTIDNWRVDLRSITYGNPFISGTYLPALDMMPVLKTLAVDYDRFASAFYATEGNLKDAFLLFNKFFTGTNGQMLTTMLFEQNRPRLNLEMVSRLKFSDFFQGNVPVSLDNLCANTGIEFNLVTYMRIHAFFEPLRNRFTRRLDEKSIPITEFLGTKKGDSKKVRKTLNKRINTVAVLRLRNIITFFRITETLANEAHVKMLLGMWSRHYLPNKIREFSFKFLNNSLAINTRLSHYVQNRQRGCTLCTIEGRVPVPDETFIHLFYDCATTKNVHERFFRLYDLPDNARKTILLGTIDVDEPFNEIIYIWAIFIQFCIWEMKIYKRIYSGTTLDIDLRFFIENCFRSCTRLHLGREKLPQGFKNALRWTEQ
jgi:hypothetical protein